MLYIFETLGEVKGRYFLPASVLLFLLHKQNPDVTWGEKNGTKSKTFVVSPGKWARSTPTLWPQPRPVSRGRGRVGSRGGPGQHPRGRPHSAARSLSASLGPLANSTLPGLPGAGLLGLWRSEKKSRGFKILGR